MVDEEGCIFVIDVSCGVVYIFDEKVGVFDVWEFVEGFCCFKVFLGIVFGLVGWVFVVDVEL